MCNTLPKHSATDLQLSRAASYTDSTRVASRLFMLMYGANACSLLIENVRVSLAGFGVGLCRHADGSIYQDILLCSCRFNMLHTSCIQAQVVHHSACWKINKRPLALLWRGPAKVKSGRD
jgi:hypothetical protein